MIKMIYILLPAYNESNNLKKLIRRIKETFNQLKKNYEIIIVNDGSEDGTKEILNELKKKYPIHILNHKKNLGLGAALNTGFVGASKILKKNDSLVVMDSDNTHDPKQIIEMCKYKNVDIIISSRYKKEAEIKGIPTYRMILSIGISLLAKIFFKLNAKDITSGYRLYNYRTINYLSKKYRKNIIQSKGFSAPLEVILKLNPLNLKIKEIPIQLNYKLRGKESKMKVLPTIYEYLKLIFKTKTSQKL